MSENGKRACARCGGEIVGRDSRAVYCADCHAVVRAENNERHNAKMRRTEHMCLSCGCDISNRNYRAKYCADCAKARHDDKMNEINARNRRTEHKCRKCGADISHLHHCSKYCGPCAKEMRKIKSAESQKRMREANKAKFGGTSRESYRIATSEFMTPEPHEYKFLRVKGGWRGQPCGGGGMNMARKFCDFGSLRNVDI